MHKTLKKLEQAGYNRDLEILEQKWKKLKEKEEHSDSRTLAALEHLEEPTYRDNKEKTASNSKTTETGNTKQTLSQN